MIKQAIPTLFTTGNAFLGFLSIYYSLSGQWGKAGICIFLATILDLFDGRLARVLNVADNFGKEMDSFADFLSFGIAPAIMFTTLNHDIFLSNNWSFELLYFIGFIYVFAAAARLAIFNNPEGTYVDKVKKNDPSDFIGMPSTFMGGIIAVVLGFHGFSTGLLGSYIPSMPTINPLLFIPFIIFTAICLLIPIPFPKIGRKFFAYKKHPILNVFITASLILFCSWALITFAIMYMILPIIQYYFRKIIPKKIP